MNCKKGEHLGSCPLCGREMICGKSVNEHHPVPKSMGGSEKVFMHTVCHHKIHTVFTERELGQEYYTFDKLREHDEISKFIRWVRKQPPEFIDKNRTSGRLKEKRLFAKRKKRR
ncbi:MAG TPA: hypothetical protein VJ946_14975 [Bacteroidales bacterium]|nr:hypothetical protein [Bacteroidales bacterium]